MQALGRFNSEDIPQSTYQSTEMPSKRQMNMFVSMEFVVCIPQNLLH